MLKLSLVSVSLSVLQSFKAESPRSRYRRIQIWRQATGPFALSLPTPDAKLAGRVAASMQNTLTAYRAGTNVESCAIAGVAPIEQQ